MSNIKFILITNLLLSFNMCAKEMDMQTFDKKCEIKSHPTAEICMEGVNDFLLNEPDSPKQGNRMLFTIQPFDSKYKSEVIDLIERIQVGEFNIPIGQAQHEHPNPC